MKNKIGDLRNHLFTALENLGNKELTPDQLKQEIERARAVSTVAQVIVDSAKVEVLYADVVGYKGDGLSEFLEDVRVEKDPRPPAVYSNLKSPLGIANGG